MSIKERILGLERGAELGLISLLSLYLSCASVIHLNIASARASIFV
jgi:hypothetical protein